MAQKINPISLRLGKTNRGLDSCWFNQSNYVNLLMKDFQIQKYIDLILKKIKFSSARYLIIYLPTKIKINIFFCNSNKNRKYVSKIFYLSYPKKHKLTKKNFFNNAHAGVSIAQNKIFEYLIKNFNNDLPFFSTNKKSSNLLCTTTQISDISKNENNSNNLLLFQNYSKLLHFLKKYNEFFIRYFLVKYFSMKQNFYFANHEILNTSKQKNNLNLNFCVAKQQSNILKKNEVFYLCLAKQGNQEVFSSSAFFRTQKEKKYFTIDSLNNMSNTILFKYIIFFLFLKIYKNKNFLALNYFQTKINNYKKITQSSNAFSRCLNNIYTLYKYKQKKKLNVNQLQKHAYTVNSEKKNNCNKFNTGEKISLPIIFFSKNFLPLKLKILNFLKKKYQTTHFYMIYL